MIQVVLPLFEKDGKLAGYLECIDRFDEETLRAQREQVRNGALTASLSVLVTAFLLYPLLLAMLRQSADRSRRLLMPTFCYCAPSATPIAKRIWTRMRINYRGTLHAVAPPKRSQRTGKGHIGSVSAPSLHDVGR
ncbi:MAG: hypothetical protein IPI44_09600 [Sulfuritalea sp.]|nr:hypothetical protein [Sulfuritalea sp.]